MDFKICLILICINFKISFQETHGVNKTLANRLAELVAVICAVILPRDEDIMIKQRSAVINSWATRCSTTFLTTKKDIMNRRPAARLHYYCKQLNKYFPERYHWYLFINSDGYVITENFRYMVAKHNHEDKVYFRSPDADSESLHVILSYAALKTFLKTDKKYWNTCSTGTIESCFEAKGITALNSRDEWFRDRLIPVNPYTKNYTNGHRKFWYCDRSMSFPHVQGPKKRDASATKKEPDCYSDFAVSFEHVRSDLMTVIDYLVYDLRPYGVNYKFDLPYKLANALTKPVTLGSRKKKSKKYNMIIDSFSVKNSKKARDYKPPFKKGGNDWRQANKVTTKVPMTTTEEEPLDIDEGTPQKSSNEEAVMIASLEDNEDEYDDDDDDVDVEFDAF